MKCPRCQAENREGLRFCEDCGARLAVTCSSCGAEVTPGKRFCGSCGASIAGAAQAAPRFSSPQVYTPRHLAERIINSKAALEGERKQVTVLFADLKGSMELLADRDPEEARKVLDPVLAHMMDAVHQYEGTVNQVMGDGIMALFGAPIGHEDHAVRACYAALRMQQSIRRHSEEIRRVEGIPIRIRIGLNSGEVVVRSIGNDLHMDYTAIGQTTHLAARMEQSAAPDSIVVAPTTAALAEGFVDLRSLGPTRVKGIADPVDVYEVLGAGAVRSRLQATAPRGLTTFVGRSAETTQLTEVLDLARSARGQVVAVVGEPGVGKSRLFWEFTRSHSATGCLIVEAGSVSYGKATPYYSVVELLKSYFGIDRHDAARAVREKVTGKVLALDRTLESTLPALLSLLDVDADDEQWSRLDPPLRRQRTLDSVKRLLLRESQTQPLIALFEDLHWIDGETQAVLDGFIDSLPTARVLLLVNYRPEYRHGWGSKTYYRQLRIDPLPAATATELLESLLGRDAALSRLKDLLVARTEGNPFFLEETVRTLVEMHVLAGERGAYRLVRAVETLVVPPTAHAVLAARIDRLTLEDKRRLQAAAVVGKDVPLSLLLAVADEPENELRAGIARLQAAEFLYEAQLFPDLEYTFKHALTHEVAYATILHDRQRALHQRAAEAIERLYGDRLGERLEWLAHHAFRGELWDKATKAFYDAGKRAFERSAPRAAAEHLEQARRALQHLPRTDDVTSLEIELQLALRAALFPLGPIHPLHAIVDRAIELATASGDQTRLSRAMAASSHNWWAAGVAHHALHIGEEAVRTAEQAGDPSGMMIANYCVGQACHLHGKLRRCVETLRPTAQMAKELERKGPTDYMRWRSINVLTWLAWALAELGEFPDALAAGEEAITLSEQHDTAWGLFHGCFGLGRVLLIQGDVNRALPVLRRGHAVAEAADLPVMANGAVLFLGYAYSLGNQLDEARATLERVATYLESIGHMSFYPVTMTYLSETHLKSGDLDKAVAAARRAVEVSSEYRQHGHEAWALHMLGRVAAARGGGEAAETHYRQSMSLASALGMRPLVAHCHLGLGKLYRRTAKPEQAQDHLTTATTMYRDMGMTYWLEQAGAEIAG